VNALLATAYISGPPNFLLYLTPADIDPASLSMMVAFAVGGLLGDTFFHLLPEIFLGEESPTKVEVKVIDSRTNILKGIGIMIGFLTFVAMDKALRIGMGGAHDHGHGHSHGKKAEMEHEHDLDEASSSALETTSTPKSRKAKKQNKAEPKPVIVPATSTSMKLSSILNLIADFTHNITDGLALSSSFYMSRSLGFTTFLAVFFHEIPHEVGDAALLIQGGFSKSKAMLAQFGTALGAFLGCLIGIAVQEFSSPSAEAKAAGGPNGFFGTNLSWGDMLLPFTCGTFIYVGTVGVIPELLERREGETKSQEWKRMLGEFACIFLGAGIMVAISI
jgi:zinc transporter 7